MAPSAPAAGAIGARFGQLLNRLRTQRGMTQARLADRAQVSTRHLSCLENRRAAPSREMVLGLSSALDLSLRDRNLLLGAAGFAPAYADSTPDHPQYAELRALTDRLIRAQDPFPALVIDREWNVLQLNHGAMQLIGWAMAGLAAPPEALGNLLTAFLHPAGLRQRTVDWERAAAVLVERARRELDLEQDVGLRRRMEARLALAGTLRVPRMPAGPSATAAAMPALPVTLRRDGQSVQLLTMVTTFGTPIDVAAQELRIESYLPADAASERFLRELAQG